MYVVYILYSEFDHNLYVGCTSNLVERIKRHNSGQVDATKLRQPLICIHTEEYMLKAEAFNRERFLKTLWAAHFKNKIKKTYLKNRQSE
jgi:putative endonuclease